jgi:C1A family cysteine protease
MDKVVRKFGTPRDKLDPRDHVCFTPLVKEPLPESVDLRPECAKIPVYDQGPLGSCTAQAIGFVYDFLENRTAADPNSFTPSRLFIYYNERDVEGTVNEDSGASIRDGIKCLNRFGVCPESMWPYDIDKFTDKPPSECYNDGRKHVALAYKRLPQTLGALKQCLASGFPFVFGFEVYSSFPSTGSVVPMPGLLDRKDGGHAVVAVGYDDAKQCFIVRNSWGPDWGDHGFFYLPYEYMLSSMAYDMWQVNKVSDNKPH